MYTHTTRLLRSAGWSCPHHACAVVVLLEFAFIDDTFCYAYLLANPHHAYAPRVTVVGLVCVCAVLFCLRNYVDILVALVSRSLWYSFCCKVRVFSQPFSYISAYLHYLIVCACRFTYAHSTVSCLHVDLRVFTCICTKYAYHCVTLTVCISTSGSHYQERGLCDCVTSPSHAPFLHFCFTSVIFL